MTTSKNTNSPIAGRESSHDQIKRPHQPSRTPDSYRYVFTPDPKEIMLLGDLSIFLAMIIISALMLMHLGILAPLRNQMHDWFAGRDAARQTDGEE